MAIDSEVKRKSVAGAGRPFRPGVVVPDGTIDNPDRQAIGWSYAGIAAEGAVEAPRRRHMDTHWSRSATVS